MEDLVKLANTYESVYLIANNPFLNRNKFKKIQNNSLIISFNHDYYKSYFKKFDRVLIIRYTPFKKLNYHGLDMFYKISSYKKTYFLGGKSDNPVYKMFKGKKSHITIKKIEYPLNKTPTTGFYIYYMLNKYINSNVKLYCFGYTFKKNSNSHHEAYEKNYCLKKKALII
jgi:hypothetical protein